jgi:hypothetical protein
LPENAGEEARAMQWSGIGGGGGAAIPVPTAPNAVVQISTAGVLSSAPYSQDQIVPAWVITAFGPTGASSVEVGTTIAAPGFTASYTSPPASAILTDNAGSAAADVTATPGAFASPGTFTKTANNASVSFTLSARSASSPTKTATASIIWYPRLRYGTGAPGLRTAAAILALASSPLASGRAGSFSYAAGNTAANLKAYYAIPSAFGAPTFKSGGLPFAITLVAAAVPVTSNGVTQNYDLYESDNVGLGTFTLDVT